MSGAIKAAKVSVEVRRTRTAEAYADIVPIMTELRQGGATLQAIADKLNSDGHTTRRGAAWNQVQVKRVLDRNANRE